MLVARALGGAASIASGTFVAGCGIGLLLACIRSGTVLTASTITYAGTKVTVAGVDMIRKVIDEDRVKVLCCALQGDMLRFCKCICFVMTR
jgi:hypothetical protein